MSTFLWANRRPQRWPPLCRRSSSRSPALSPCARPNPSGRRVTMTSTYGPIANGSKGYTSSIHRNPVTRGLVSRPEDWAWSSYCHYLTGVEGAVEIESEWTARRRGLARLQSTFPPLRSQDGAPRCLEVFRMGHPPYSIRTLRAVPHPSGRTRHLRKTLLLAIFSCVLAIVAIRFWPSHSSVPAPTRIWSVDLYGDPDFLKRQIVSEVSLNAPDVSFINDSQIICSFYGGETMGYNPSLKPSGYYVLEINVNDGKTGRKLIVQSVDDHSRAVPVVGGFVVLGGGEVRKFNSTFVPQSSYPTPIENPDHRPDVWLMDVAPDGHSLFLYSHRVGNPQGTWRWLDTGDLSVSRSMPGPLITIPRASDTSGVVAPMGMGDSLFSGTRTAQVCSQCDAQFLADDVLFLASEHSYAIKSLQGKSLGSGDLDVWASNFARSANSTRFAYSTGHYNGTGFPIQTQFKSVSSRTLVVDWSTNKPVAEVDTDEPVGNPSAGLSQMALALSPNGKLLAVLVHHTLSLYRLP